MSILHFIGITGVGFYLLAYTLLQLGVLRGSGYIYTLLNLAAAGCVLVSLVEEFNLSSFLIQVSWITISIVGLTRMILRQRTLRFTDAETDFARMVLPDLPKSELRSLLNSGRWAAHVPGTVLTRQGEPVEDLVYVAAGSADVIKDGTHVARISAGSFVGEVTCLTGVPATATVIVGSAVHCFRIPAGTLRAYLKTRPATQDHLERSFGADLRRKLQTSADKVVVLTLDREPVAA